MSWKPTVIPKGFVLVIDTREQQPLFTDTKIQCVKKCLKDGDYSILGMEEQVTVERKKISDLVTYIINYGKGRKTTKQKLERLSAMIWAGLIIEASTQKLSGKIAYQRKHRITKETVRGFRASCEVKYGIPTFNSANRKELERWILDRLVRVYRGK